MRSLIQKLAMALVVAVMGASLAYAPLVGASATSSAKSAVCKGVNAAAGGGGGCSGGKSEINHVIKVAVNILSVLAGVIAVIMIIVAGIKYTTSGGDSSKISSAKSALIAAIVGVVIVALAQFIVHFVLGNIV
jgi:hypothetical protein